ncbi:hypothetical protein AC792_07625, partial [Arthrobacter sp. RIT-PI-e]
MPGEARDGVERPGLGAHHTGAAGARGVVGREARGQRPGETGDGQRVRHQGEPGLRGDDDPPHQGGELGRGDRVADGESRGVAEHEPLAGDAELCGRGAESLGGGLRRRRTPARERPRRRPGPRPPLPP